MEYTPHDIDAAVRRFWDGDTSLEEETALRNYFRFREVPTARLICVAPCQR